MRFLLGNIIPMAVWETTCHRLHDLSLLGCSRLYRAGTWKSVIPCNPNFEEVLRYLQDLSNVESESECTLGTTQNMMTVIKPSLFIVGFYSNIFIISLFCVRIQ
jgi:hypothetical protein